MSEIHPVDIQVGAAIRKRRKELGLSQEYLASALGITFQQIQKYESGANRISASKLFLASQTLKTTIDHFFTAQVEGFTVDLSDSEIQANAFALSAEGVELSKYFTVLSRTKRRGVIALVKAILADQDETV